LLAGAERQTVIEDYTRTNVDLQENLARQPGGQLAQELFARLNLLCRPEDITMATDYIAERGGVRAYLGEHITDADYDRVVRVVRTRLGLGSPSSLVPRPQQLHTQKEPATGTADPAAGRSWPPRSLPPSRRAVQTRTRHRLTPLPAAPSILGSTSRSPRSIP